MQKQSLYMYNNMAKMGRYYMGKMKVKKVSFKFKLKCRQCR